MKAHILIAIALVATAGCAKKSSDVAATYVSSQSYKSQSCAQLDEDRSALASRVQQISGDQDDRATRDAVVTGVGAIIFWPALILLAQGDDAEELGRLKGEYEAIQRAQEANNCPV